MILQKTALGQNARCGSLKFPKFFCGGKKVWEKFTERHRFHCQSFENLLVFLTRCVVFHPAQRAIPKIIQINDSRPNYLGARANSFAGSVFRSRLC